MRYTFRFGSSVLVAFFLFISEFSSAQELAAGIELGIPVSKSDNSGLGIGGTVRYEGPWGTKTSAMIDGGLIYFSGKTVGATVYPSWTVIPVQAGVKYYVNNLLSGFYVSGQIGMHFISIASESQQDFGFAPGLGYHLEKADIGIRFQSILGAHNDSFNFIGIRGAYILKEKNNFRKKRR